MLNAMSHMSLRRIDAASSMQVSVRGLLSQAALADRSPDLIPSFRTSQVCLLYVCI